MKSKYLTLLIILTASFSFSQTIELAGKQITFGMSEKELQGSFWEEGGQIESNYPYINVYEYSDDKNGIYGQFYNDKLVCIEISYYNEAPGKEIEDLYLNIPPYSHETRTEGVVEICDYYKTDAFYIQSCSVHMAASFIIIPIGTLEEINKKHSDYLARFFMGNKIK